MYVVLTILFLLIFWAGSLLGQQKPQPMNQQDLLMKRLQMREEMHRRMMEKVLKGTGSDEDLFKEMEAYMTDVIKDSFTGFDASMMGQEAQNFTMEWNETSTGRTLVITPKTPDQKLDINVENGLITIKGNVEHKTPNGISVSNFSNSLNIPEDCDPTKVKMDQKNGKILVQFPYRGAKPAKVLPGKDLKPIPPSESDVQI
jgi:HSP20 family molecular chaperone IbpA